MEGLEAALERARRAYAEKRAVMHARPEITAARNRIRDVSPRSMLHPKPRERARAMLEELDWWGIPRPRDLAEAERAKEEVLAWLKQDAGSPGGAELREAGFELLDWWREQGNRVTATKVDRSQGAEGEAGAGDVDGRTYAPSAAVAWLAEQLPKIVPWLGQGAAARPGWTPALDAAYTIAQAWRTRWRDEEPPHWTEFEPRPPIVIPKPGGIR